MKKILWFIPLLGILLLDNGCATSKAVQTKPKWQSMVMMPKTNLPAIHLYQKLDPIWWFGNINEPKPPAWYRPGGHMRNLMWHLRNPLSNFSDYVIGVADKETIRWERYPAANGNHPSGWNFAATQRRLLYLPFVDYKRGRFEFYFGWRERGNFGIKLNFRQALPKRP